MAVYQNGKMNERSEHQIKNTTKLHDKKEKDNQNDREMTRQQNDETTNNKKERLFYKMTQ